MSSDVASHSKGDIFNDGGDLVTTLCSPITWEKPWFTGINII